jgi:hypothetical protein
MVGVEHLLLLLRVMLAVVFAASACGKLRDLRAFTAAVEDFAVVPRSWARPAAIAVVTAEVLLVVLLGAGGPVLAAGFGGAVALLVAFTVALGRALRHRNVVSCNCFGAATGRLSRLDMARNACLISAAVAGTALAQAVEARTVSAAEVAVVGLASASLAMVLINFSDVVRTLLRPFTVPGVA